MEELSGDDATTTAEGEESLINEVEVRTIFNKGLEGFFKAQLKLVVRIF